jgi:hypothetical protein
MIWFLLFLLLPSYSWAAITLDVASSSGGTTSTSHSHTVAVDANIAIICISQRDQGGAVTAPSAVTIGGENATSLSSSTSAAIGQRADLYYKLSPLTGAQTVAVTGGAGTDRMVTGVMTFKNVAQTSTFNTASTGTGVNTTAYVDSIASAVGELVVMCGGVRVLTSTPSPEATAPVSTEQFELGFDSGGTTTLGYGYTEAGDSPTINMRVTLSASETWVAVAASMREVAASSTFGHLKRRTP